MAKFHDGSPALVHRGRVYCAGFLPALDYIKRALDARFALEEKMKAEAKAISTETAALLERSANPWEYPATIRDLILAPVRDAGVVRPIECDTPLVDAVLMKDERGLLVPLANYTNVPIAKVSLRVATPKPIIRVESAIRGALEFQVASDQRVEVSLPLESNDFLKLSYGR